VGEAWPAVTGSGLAWGRGLHGEGPPAGRSGELKAEGDGKSPAGVFSLGGAYGYRAQPPKGARWPYTPVDKAWECVDDSASKAYGTIVNTEGMTPDWTSSEKMRRRDALYTWVIDVAHNPSHRAKAGSCIFLHVWRTAASPTVGCTAMKQADLETLLAWMDPAAQPVYVLLPKAELAALASSWGLPKQPP
jgi:zinc D-Ala-D-Ala dipeptidase